MVWNLDAPNLLTSSKVFDMTDTIVRKTLLSIIVLLFIISNANGVWEILPGKVGCTAIVTDSSETRIIVHLYYGGYWRSVDGGITWDPLNTSVCSTHPTITCNKIEAYDSNADTIVARSRFTRNGGGIILRQQISLTLDGGTTWYFPHEAGVSNYTEHMLIDQNDRNKLYYMDCCYYTTSEDFGETWSDRQVVDPGYMQKFEFIQDPFNDSSLFCCGIHGNNLIEPGGILRSENRGDSWDFILDASEVCNNYYFIPIMDIDRLSNGDLVACVPVGIDINDQLITLNSILRSTDNGETWSEEYPDIASGQAVERLVELPEFPGHLLIGGYYEENIPAFLSTDYGMTFTRCEMGSDIDMINPYGLYANKFNNSTFVCSIGEGIWKTNDGGQTWCEYFSPDLGSESEYKLTENFVFYKPRHGNALYVYNENSDISGPYYYPLPSEDSLRFSYPIQFKQDDKLIGFASYIEDETSTGMLRTMVSEDNGTNWYTIGDGLPVYKDIFSYPIDSYFGENLSRILLFAPQEDLNSWNFHVSLDTGRTWTTYDNLPLHAGLYSEFHQTAEYILAAHREEGIFRSYDNGETWENLELVNPFYLSGTNAVVIDEENDDIYSFGGIVGYRYHGISWDTLGLIPEQDPFSDATGIPTDHGMIFLLTCTASSTVYISTDGGYEWSPLAESILYTEQMTRLYGIEYDPYRHRVWINSPLGMMWQDADYFTDVVERDRPELVVDYEILSVYPNPFNSVATANFRIDTSGEFSMKLYNINGQEVQTLLEDANNPCEHTIQINAGNLSSGTYYLRLITEESEAIRKLVLVK